VRNTNFYDADEFESEQESTFTRRQTRLYAEAIGQRTETTKKPRRQKKSLGEKSASRGKTKRTRSSK
jgi:hypothetical protein